MGARSATTEDEGALSKERPFPQWFNVFAVLVWLSAAIVAFLPFAFDTSPWDAVILRVPGNQGNWWHALVGAPFFLAYAMLWLRLRILFSARPPIVGARRVIWGAVGLSMTGTAFVEAPFLLHLAGTSEWQRLLVLGLGFGTLIASVVVLLLRRRRIPPAHACLLGLDAAYLANLALCLVVYSEATGTMWSRAGWLVSMVLVWPIALELVWLMVCIPQEQHAAQAL